MRITVPAPGARLGRSSRNDIVLTDPLLSRHHCRLFFKTNEGLWVADLGSANQTLVNKKPIQEVRVRPGDIITVGDTVIRVLDDGSPAPSAPPAAVPSAGPGDKPAPVVDLGLSERKDEPRSASPLARLGREHLIVILCVVSALAAASWVWRIYSKPSVTRIAPPPTPARETFPLEFEYEKVEGSRDNIFRYYLSLKADRTLSVQIDDLQFNRHLLDETKISTNEVRNLARYLDDSAFFSLKDEYQGLPPPGILSSWDLSVTIGKRFHRTAVINRVEPDIFKEVRDKIEMFGKNLLHHWTMQVPVQRLKQMALESYELARKLYDDRTVKYENLSSAIKSLKKCHGDLRSVEPKPDYYAASLTLLSDCEKELQEKYEECNFQSTRSLNLPDWRAAAEQLRVILELIPDEEDPRNQDARKKLLEVENRLQSKK